MVDKHSPGVSNVDYVAYVKYSIHSDLALNRKLTEREFNVELAAVLLTYLQHPENEDELIALGLRGLSMLEREIEAETGAKVSFHQTKKCALAVYEIWASGNQEGLAELRQFASELVVRPVPESAQKV